MYRGGMAVPLKLYLIHTVVQCTPQVFGATQKGITVAYNKSFRILCNLSPRCSIRYMFATNYVKSFNERIRLSIFILLCRLERSDNLLFFTLLFITEVK